MKIDVEVAQRKKARKNADKHMELRKPKTIEKACIKIIQEYNKPLSSREILDIINERKWIWYKSDNNRYTVNINVISGILTRENSKHLFEKENTSGTIKYYLKV